MTDNSNTDSPPPNTSNTSRFLSSALGAAANTVQWMVGGRRQGSPEHTEQPKLPPLALKGLRTCNNDERAWFKQALQQTQALGMRAIACKAETPKTEVQELVQEVQTYRTTIRTEFKKIAQEMNKRGRHTACQISETDWQTMDVHLERAIIRISRLIGGAYTKTTAASPEDDTDLPPTTSTPEGQTSRVGAEPDQSGIVSQDQANYHSATGSVPDDQILTTEDLPPEVRLSGDRLSMVTTAGEEPIFQPPGQTSQQAAQTSSPTNQEEPDQPAASHVERFYNPQYSRNQQPGRHAARLTNPRGRTFRGRGYHMAYNQGYRQQIWQERQEKASLQWQLDQQHEQLRRLKAQLQNRAEQYQPDRFQHPREPREQRQDIYRSVTADGVYHPSTTRNRQALRSDLHPTIDKFARLMTNYGQDSLLNPYALAEEDQPDHWYLQQFRHPFNQPPPPNAPVQTDYKKLEHICPPFSGREHDFYRWAFMFIPAIHRQRCPIHWKATLLIKALNTSDERLQDLTQGVGNTPDDYARVINRLVDWYGHPRGLLAARQAALDQTAAVAQFDIRAMEKLLVRLEDFCNSAAQMGRADDLANHKLFDGVFEKLDRYLARQYLDWTRRHEARHDLPSLLAWLQEDLQDQREIQRRNKRQQEHSSYIAQQKPDSCPLDGGQHDLPMCTTFQQLTPTERRRKAFEFRRCYSCLKTGHQMSTCTEGVVCSKCTRAHHHLLHGSKRGTRPRRQGRSFLTTNQKGELVENTGSEDETWSEDSDLEDRPVCLKAAEKAPRQVALQTTSVWVSNPYSSSRATLNAMLDSGATTSFISKRAATELGLKGRVVQSTITGFGGSKMEGSVVLASIRIAAITNKRRSFWLHVQVIEDPAASYTPFDWTVEKHRFTHLKELPLSPPAARPVDIMIGMNAPELLTSLVPDREGNNRGEPIARLTRLGWVVGGPATQHQKDHSSHFAFRTQIWTPPKYETTPWTTFNITPDIASYHTKADDARDVSHSKQADTELGAMLMRMWEFQDTPTSQTTNIMEQAILDKLRTDLIFKEGRYSLPTLWKTPKERLPNNFFQAKKRLEALDHSKYFKDSHIRETYLAHRQQWEENKYIERVHTLHPQQDQAYYLPHFPVIRMDKATTRVRIVMDAAARGPDGRSLNDRLQKGPKLVNELQHVFLRFRARRFSFAADVKQMFHQIGLREEDRSAHRFLWKENNQIKVYQWRVHPFGSAASPCVAIFVIKEHARRFKQQYPRAAEMVVQSTLVDDNLDSVDTEEEAIKLGKEAIELYRKAGMTLRKFVSNSPMVLQTLQSDEQDQVLQLSDICNKDLQLPDIKTLGVAYITKEDAFTFSMEQPEESIWTKRRVLRFEARLYDPHGLIAPFIIQARVLLQQMWRAGYDWDVPLQDPILQDWTEWLQALQQLPQLRIPRCTFDTAYPDPISVTYHVFCDASANAYAAVAYAVNNHGPAGISSKLLLCKARVAPVKQTSIPRLELMGAMLVIDLIEAIRNTFPAPLAQFRLWTDSTNVLCWLRNDSRTLQAFVGQRIAKIQHATNLEAWRWVNSDNNPADLPSKGTNSIQTLKSSFWLTGPEFLKQPPHTWPQLPTPLFPTATVLTEVKKSAGFALLTKDTTQTEGDSLGLKRISTWPRMLRVITICLRWRTKNKGPFEAQELENAEQTAFKIMQQARYQPTIRHLQETGVWPQRSPLAALYPKIDHRGLLRAQTRVARDRRLQADLRSPIILPRDFFMTIIMIKHIHETNLHAGPQHLTTILRQRFWIPRATRLIRTVVAKCVQCRRQRARPSNQIMAMLPMARIPAEKTKPFTHTGLDMAGPFSIKISRHVKQKAYFLLLTCLTVRAVHLEPLEDASTKAFLMAFQRFMARRGRPRTLVSDNGTNFKGAQTELKDLLQQAPKDFSRTQWQTKWTFNPPKGPHFGGAFEKLIHAAKNALYHALPYEASVPWPTFITALTVVEGILNTRPLTYRSADHEEIVAITPADFLNVAAFAEIPEIPEYERSIQRQWHALQLTLDQLWYKFTKLAVPYLQTATKWTFPSREFKVGDVVTLLDATRRGRWPLGKITKVIQSHDNIVRRVHVLCNGTTYLRPVASVMLLLPLETNPDEQNKDGDQAP